MKGPEIEHAGNKKITVLTLRDRWCGEDFANIQIRLVARSAIFANGDRYVQTI